MKKPQCNLPLNFFDIFVLKQLCQKRWEEGDFARRGEVVLWCNGNFQKRSTL